MCFFSRSFMVSGLLFNPLIVCFCVWYKEIVQFDSFTCCCQVFSTLFIKESRHLCWELVDHICWVYFQTPFSVPLIYVSIYMLEPYCFGNHNFVILKSWNVIPSALVFFYSIPADSETYSHALKFYSQKKTSWVLFLCSFYLFK